MGNTSQLVELRESIRHSASHVMADAVKSIFPQAKLAIGPPTEDGFYYDFDLPRPLTQEDLILIEERMRETIASDLPFLRDEINRSAARKMFADQPFKLEIIEEIPDEILSIYSHGEFVDLCQGPHVASTKEIKAFKLLSVAGAYWRGDEKRPMLQRIYGTAFETPGDMEEHLKRLEEALRRDHRKLGKELDLFSIHDESGSGLICWHPKGARVRDIIEGFWKKEHYKAGYELVYSPHIGKASLWQASGHLDFYQDSMYSPIDVEGQQYYLRPMNCPFHILMYKNALKSYRELPLRLAELGTVYRYERSGVLHGLLRVRGFTQDDAHIFCRPDQVEDEVSGVLDLTFNILGAFGFKEYEIHLADRPGKYVGEPADWDRATEALRRAIESKGLKYTLDKGGGAFYGPKIDVKIRDALNRPWQCTTIQFDFNLPERFELTFVGQDGMEHRPFMVHRALLGSLERFMGILIEHYAGAFPIWLAPIQAVLIPIADRHLDYSREVQKELTAMDLRVQVDERQERMNLKIREAQLQKIPYMLVVGDSETSSSTVAVRLRSGENLGPQSLSAFKEMAKKAIDTKAEQPGL